MVTKLVWYLFSVGGVILVSLAAALWVACRPESRRARRTLLAVLVTYAAGSTWAVGHGIDRLLVIGFEPFTRADVPKGRTAIVVLGSGSYTALDWDMNTLSIPDPAASMRVLEAVRVFRLTNADWVISSGGHVDPYDSDEPTGQTMRDTLERLGVPPERILVEIKSRNTHEEAVVVAPMLAARGIEHTVLVTSDIHMRRSLGAFRAEGVDVIPAIARHRHDSGAWMGRYLPSQAGLGETAHAMHEAVGLAYYFVRGWHE